MLHEDAKNNYGISLLNLFLAIAWLALDVDPCIHQLFQNDVPLVLQCSPQPEMLLYVYFQSAIFHLSIKTQLSFHVS